MTRPSFLGSTTKIVAIIVGLFTILGVALGGGQRAVEIVNAPVEIKGVKAKLEVMDSRSVKQSYMLCDLLDVDPINCDVN